MRLCKTVEEMRSYVNAVRAEGKTVGLVPTMGYLHQGHLSLMQEAKRRCDVVVVSIFVNPTQFGPKEDYQAYPRDLQRDAGLAAEVGVDVIFAPEVAEMYPPDFNTFVEVAEVSEPLCGASRPGHFRGVATIVTKLFNIVRPHMAFFGRKDFQQVLVIKRLVEDLNLDVNIVDLPIVREEDGLALSSRNVYLTAEERRAARVLFRSLSLARRRVAAGERNTAGLKELVEQEIRSEPLAVIDYVEILSLPRLKPLDTLQDKALLALAVRFGKTRLIDNTVLEV
ncbi:pantoate--beta-alanine ligase [Desulforamulus hydrothermalis]|uniref:Pantothenate synthetase n=1 Tax=Desulforamulus hydrothermalis Lam5 = DSM 18033 TaxID=1121428 RepID=K8DZU3_9FIRM|nr:pantoate--beta-alanine ligase [Desulforamulus hydrothermalis]CCO08677.1 Pantothenate synthetase [Desulforamulus hydrothermalis Lam5 = DSM 18033]SHH38745.1 pantothenate synthetase [Desulforamulus hydrothermalis Lam5 = DSM 18033]